MDKKYSFHELGLENCKKLEGLYIEEEYNRIQADEIDLTGFHELQTISIQGDIKSLNCSGLDKLEWLWIDGSGLKTLKVKGCVNLRGIKIRKDSLSKLDLTGLKELTELCCRKSVLIIGANEKLEVDRNWSEGIYLKS